MEEDGLCYLWIPSITAIGASRLARSRTPVFGKWGGDSTYPFAYLCMREATEDPRVNAAGE